MNWQTLARCRGLNPNIFFEESKRGPNEMVLRNICSTCPVQKQCLDDALRTLDCGGDMRFQYIGWRAGFSDRKLKSMVRANRKKRKESKAA